MWANFMRQDFHTYMMKRNAAGTYLPVQMITTAEMPDSKYAYCHCQFQMLL